MFIVLGLLIGFIAAVPLGPVNVFVVSQTLKRDFSHGFLAGVTTAILDAVYCLVALMGLLSLKLSLTSPLLSLMKVVAGFIILLVSYRLIHDAKNFDIPQEGDKIPSAAARPILGVVLLYVTNPSLYVFWIAVAGTMTAHNLVQSRGWTAAAFAAACGLGSFVWYMLLVRFVAKRQTRIHPETFRKILYYLGLALAGLGVYTIG
ncbi:MAG TPA: LysE family transporter, partial [Burkholderiales bacterium]|nr:LysE family transporter [Burkholderiales bacterium]